MADITAFSDQVSKINKGATDSELTAEMVRLVKQVRDTGKKGSLTLTMNVQMLGNNNEDVVKITPDIKLSLPKVAQPAAIFWSTADGDLLRNDPQQNELEFEKIVDDKPAKIIQINGD